MWDSSGFDPFNFLAFGILATLRPAVTPAPWLTGAGYATEAHRPIHRFRDYFIKPPDLCFSQPVDFLEGSRAPHASVDDTGFQVQVGLFASLKTLACGQGSCTTRV